MELEPPLDLVRILVYICLPIIAISLIKKPRHINLRGGHASIRIKIWKSICRRDLRHIYGTVENIPFSQWCRPPSSPPSIMANGISQLSQKVNLTNTRFPFFRIIWLIVTGITRPTAHTMWYSFWVDRISENRLFHSCWIKPMKKEKIYISQINLENKQFQIDDTKRHNLKSYRKA